MREYEISVFVHKSIMLLKVCFFLNVIIANYDVFTMKHDMYFHYNTTQVAIN